MDQAATLRMMTDDMSGKGTKHNNNSGDGIKVVAVTSGKGGVGKTNVVANLAMALVKMGKRVLIFDADMGLGNIDVLLGLAPIYNLSHVLKDGKGFLDILITGPSGIMILPSGSGVDSLCNLSPEQQINLFSEMEKLGDLIDVMLIDTAAGINSNVLFFNMAAQEILVIATPEPTSITDAYALIKVLYTKHNVKHFRLLVNSVRSSEEGLNIYRKLSLVADKFLKVSVDYSGHILTDFNIPKSVRQQRLFLEIFPESKASTCFAKLARTVANMEPPQGLKGNIQFFWNHLVDKPNIL
jgi:flagellar biosynthesis protein FlhG